MAIKGERVKSLATLRWDTYPVRVCRSLHHCEICSREIRLGESYYDGGHNRRGHQLCVENGGYNKPLIPEARADQRAQE